MACGFAYTLHSVQPKQFPLTPRLQEVQNRLCLQERIEIENR
jgi:hypothetical protein